MKLRVSSAAPTPALRLLAGLLVVYLLAPFAAALTHLGQADWRGADAGALADATLISVAATTLSTLLVSLGGIPLGFLLAQADRSRRRRIGWSLLGIAVQMPLALPPLSSGVLLLFLLGYSGPLGRLSGGALTDSFAGIVLAEAFVSAPFLIIAARSAFRAIDPALSDVAATLGHRPGAIFRRVSLPLCARAILAGAVLAWLRGFGEFGATVMVAYHPYSLPVFTYVAFGSEGLPAMLPVIAPTLAAAGLAIALLLKLQRRGRPTHAAAEIMPRGRAELAAAQHFGPAPALSLTVHRRLDGFTLDVAWHTTARRLAIVGGSGSGKSMTLRAMAGLEPGRVEIGGQEMGDLPPQARNVAYVPQSYGLFPHLRIGAQIGFATNADPGLARRWIKRLGLEDLLARMPAELSLGQQQRVTLARALSRRSASLLLLDEPFSALDAPLRDALCRELLALQTETGARCVLITHDPAEAMLLADELLVLDRGLVLQSGPASEVFARPASEQVARLLGAISPAEGEAVGPDRIALGNGVTLRVAGAPLSAGPVGWAVRPHQLRVGPQGEYPATIVRRGEVQAGQRQLTVRLGDAEVEALTDPDCPEAGLCRVSIDPASLQVWPRA